MCNFSFLSFHNRVRFQNQINVVKFTRNHNKIVLYDTKLSGECANDNLTQNFPQFKAIESFFNWNIFLHNVPEIFLRVHSSSAVCKLENSFWNLEKNFIFSHRFSDFLWFLFPSHVRVVKFLLNESVGKTRDKKTVVTTKWFLGRIYILRRTIENFLFWNFY